MGGDIIAYNEYGLTVGGGGGGGEGKRIFLEEKHKYPPTKPNKNTPLSIILFCPGLSYSRGLPQTKLRCSQAIIALLTDLIGVVALALLFVILTILHVYWYITLLMPRFRR